MKETLYTIPLMDAFQADDECPFCFIERKLEQDAVDFILGSAYMESDIREQTDTLGFCHNHHKKMYDYGNTLGNALMLKTRINKLNRDLSSQLSSFAPGKISLLNKLKKPVSEAPCTNPIAAWIQKEEQSCYICNYTRDTFFRYTDTFFHLYKNNPEFTDILKNSKGFCLPHFGGIMEFSEKKLNDRQKADFYLLIFSLMESNMQRLAEDISWFVDKSDYRNKDADWKNSRDAIPRGMQKLGGGYPADIPYRENK